MSSKRDQRRSAPIHAYVGPNGGGKSLAMVYDTVPSILLGRRVLSTVTIVDPETGDPHSLYEPLTQWRQLLEVEHADVLLDEVQGVVSSRQHQSLPPAVGNLLLQLRRRDVLLRWSSPSYARADLMLREVTQAVTYCRGYRPEPQRVEFVEGCDGKRCRQDHEHLASAAKLWGANRWFLWRTYDAFQFDEFTTGKRESLDKLAMQFYRRTRDDAQEWYRTLDPVDYIVDATEAGTCLTCGGSRRRPRCSCPTAGDGGGAPAQRGATEPAHGSTTEAVA